MSLELVVEPASEPVELAEVKAYLKIADATYTETGETTSGTDFNNTTSPLTLATAVTTYSQMTFTQGDLLKIDNEVLQVLVVDGASVTFGRGQQGTLIATHTEERTIYSVSGYTTEDEELENLITAARMRIEEDTWRQLIKATWVLRRDTFPANNGDFVLPKPPLQSVTYIKYYDTNGVQQTIDSSLYDVDNYGAGPGIIRPAYGQTWPTPRTQLNAVEVKYIAGYTTVPRGIIKALTILIADGYANRESDIVGQGYSAMPLRRDAEYWLEPYRVHDVRLLEFLK